MQPAEALAKAELQKQKDLEAQQLKQQQLQQQQQEQQQLQAQQQQQQQQQAATGTTGGSGAEGEPRNMAGPPPADTRGIPAPACTTQHFSLSSSDVSGISIVDDEMSVQKPADEWSVSELLQPNAKMARTNSSMDW